MIFYVICSPDPGWSDGKVLLGTDPGRSGGVVSGIFEEDGLDQTEIEQLIDTFPSQSIDFWCFTFTGLRQVREFIKVGLNKYPSSW